MKANRKTNGAEKVPEFVARAERAFVRVARKVRAENRRLGLPTVVFPNGKPAAMKAQRVREVDAHRSATRTSGVASRFKC